MKNALFHYWNGGQIYYTAALSGAITYSRFSPRRELNPDDRRKATAPAEYEALVWLRDNTPEGAIIADGRYLQINKYFAGSAFSERAFFLGGWGYAADEDTGACTDEKIRRDTFSGAFLKAATRASPRRSRSGAAAIIINQYITPGLRLTSGSCGSFLKTPRRGYIS